MSDPRSSAGKIFHSNDHYTVRVNKEVTEYDVVNDLSTIVEFSSASLPEAIFAAENLNVVLKYRTFEWVDKNESKKYAGDDVELGSLTRSN